MKPNAAIPTLDGNAPSLMLLAEALDFAASKHRDQRRKDPDRTPYINHPIGVFRLLAVEGGVREPVALCAALLHDTLEDTETTAEELERHFGQSVLRVVLELTDDKRLPKQQRKRLQVERAAHASLEARLVKLADKICNLRDVAERPPVGWDLARQQGYFDWAREVIERLRGTHTGLETIFDQAYARRPRA